MNYYEKAIRNLNVYDNISSERIKNLVDRVKINLEEGKQNFEMEQRLKDHAPIIFNRMKASNREKKVFMQTIVEEFFEILRTKENERFLKCGTDLYSIEAKSGTYYFELECDPFKNRIVLSRRMFEYKRKPKGALLMISRFPSLVPEEEEDDVETLKTILVDMLNEFKRLWKHLKVEQTPTNSTSTMSLENES